MNSDAAAKSTNHISFMLVEVIKNGRRICQILEAPGEYYFNPQSPNDGFPNYINTIIASTNRKIWTIMVEPDWKDASDRKNYVKKIHHLKQRMRPKDNAVFVFNKIDLTNFVIGVGQINKSAAIKEVNNLYPDIFGPFTNQNPVTKSRIADGNIVENMVVNLKEVVIDGKIRCTDVTATVSANSNAPLLLGNEVLNRVAAYAIDNENKTINFKLR